ncbi:hypothetical protein KFE25_008141 [Diacronema lutheri]|uniref:Uncharacterized protein n=1 Tax=Diacronema lutheri TaxID=2081491 RepID=A0A8J6C9Q4_DIALT|nr:hypothetical protein KFE25_008141 [Diacronema lutheri]
MADADGRTPLHHAACGGRADEVRGLLAAGASALTCDDARWTPLHSAASAGHVAVCELLLDASADANAANEAGCSPLHYALSKGHGAIAARLLAAGSDPTKLDRAGLSPLHRGCAASQLDAVRAACEALPAHALNLPAAGGSSALHLAAFEAREDICAALIDAGADLHAVDADGRTPLDLCPGDVRARLAARAGQ